MLDEPCPDEQALLDMGQGALSAARQAQVEAHIARCPDCALLVVELARQDDASPAPDAPPLERSVGRYTLQHILGAGGMGVVWAAHDPQLDRAVAIKLVRPALGAGEEERARRARRLMQEARSLAALSHPHILTIFDVGEEGGAVWLATALLEGQTLRAWAQGRAWREALTAILSVADALGAAHRAGVVHGDVKPDNVILDRAGRPVLTDFGLARRAGDTSGDHGGTISYMAPEQLAGEPASAAADQYALCVMACELCAGTHPLERGERLATIRAIQRGDVQSAAGALPEPLIAALRRGMAHDPAARFEDMGALITALTEASAPAAITRRAALLASALACVAVGLWAAYHAPSSPAPRGETAPAPPRSPQAQVAEASEDMAHDVAPVAALAAAIEPASWALHVARSAAAQAAPPVKAAPRRAAPAPARPLGGRSFGDVLGMRLMIDCNIEMGDLARCREASRVFDAEIPSPEAVKPYIAALPEGERARTEANIRAFMLMTSKMFAAHDQCREALRRHHDFYKMLALYTQDAAQRGHFNDRAYREDTFKQQHPRCAGVVPVQQRER